MVGVGLEELEAFGLTGSGFACTSLFCTTTLGRGSAI